ncbi:TetR/AcrR family transcriptional regulator [Brevibacterium marinum]|uniref:AcrR family transcriptional regulator n=1 Tax=Brevibacterium marinum TaxID=418643 RepID=A0A846RXH1_9MICO|nr:AcrR family transcriptional regulator [Brevibacterium marinum]
MNTDASEGPSTGPSPARRPGPSRRRAQADTTRSQLLLAAERLYAIHGISEVSNRQVAEAAGSANNSAVGYYVGTKTDLLEAILRSHNEPIARGMKEMIDRTAGSPDLHDYIECLVRPYTDHLAQLRRPSGFARVIAQVVTDPTLLRNRVFDSTLGQTLRQAFNPMWAQIADAPKETIEMRQQVLRNMVLHTCAEQERSAHFSEVPADWSLVSEILINSVAAVLTHVPSQPGGLGSDS